jgi:hypothetical protein
METIRNVVMGFVAVLMLAGVASAIDWWPFNNDPRIEEDTKCTFKCNAWTGSMEDEGNSICTDGLLLTREGYVSVAASFIRKQAGE